MSPTSTVSLTEGTTSSTFSLSEVLVFVSLENGCLALTLKSLSEDTCSPSCVRMGRVRESSNGQREITSYACKVVRVLLPSNLASSALTSSES